MEFKLFSRKDYLTLSFPYQINIAKFFLLEAHQVYDLTILDTISGEVIFYEVQIAQGINLMR